MNSKLIELCLIEIDKININIDRKRYKVKYSNEYYLKFIFLILNDINKWSFIINLKDYNSKFKFHYKTIYNKFVFWSKKNVFYNAFYNYIFKKNTNLLLIDATSINNKYGSECVTINPEYKKKKITKLSIISNKDNFIHSVEVFEIKNNEKKYKTSIHDVKMINKSLEKINVKNKSKYFCLLGDKAYKTKENFKINNKKVIIITHDKSNTIIKNTKFKNKKLMNRIKIENTINNIKKYERVKTRKERNIKTYMSWLYIASLINNLNVNK